MNFVDAVVAFLNIGIFSTLICRFTGANMAMLVFCALLYMGSEPMETVGIMLTYLVFMRLTIYTQKRKLNFKKLQVFKGMRVFVPVLLIVISLFLYPFAALAIFLLLFMVEILAQIKEEIPEDRQLSKGELTKYIVIGSLLTTVSMIAVKFIPAAWYYALGGAVGLSSAPSYGGWDRTATDFPASGIQSSCSPSSLSASSASIWQTGWMICAAA